jgi:hypothetical protein
MQLLSLHVLFLVQETFLAAVPQILLLQLFVPIVGSVGRSII